MKIVFNFFLIPKAVGSSVFERGVSNPQHSIRNNGRGNLVVVPINMMNYMLVSSFVPINICITIRMSVSILFPLMENIFFVASLILKYFIYNYSKHIS